MFKGKVFVPNFTMFTGEELIDTTEPFLERCTSKLLTVPSRFYCIVQNVTKFNPSAESVGKHFCESQFSNKPTVKGYVTGMLIDNLIFHNFSLNKKEIIITNYSFRRRVSTYSSNAC